MKIHLLAVSLFERPTFAPGLRSLEEFRGMAARDRFEVHTLCDSPSDADLILVTDLHLFLHQPRLEAFYAHPTVREMGRKVFCHDRRPNPWPACSGAFVSAEKSSFDAQNQVAVGYTGLKNHAIENDMGARPTHTPQFLATFTGANSHPLRTQIFALRDPRFHLVSRTVTGRHETPPTPKNSPEDLERARWKAFEAYRNELLNARFGLCPRGVATSSFRLYETMAVGRAPVILADDWMPPSGPQWPDFALFVPEKSIAQLPQLLERQADEWDERGAAAFHAYREHFAPDVRWHRALEGCRILKENGAQGVLERDEDHPALRRMLNASKPSLWSRLQRRLKG